MSKRPRVPPHWQWADLILIVMLGLVTLLPFLGQTRDLSSREARHAEIAREMAVSGNFVVPTLLGQEYHDKPPVMHSVIALLYQLTGETSMKLARFPSAVAAILGALVLYGLGISLTNRGTALFAAIALLGIQGYSYMARVARPDMIFTLFFVLSCLGLARSMIAGETRGRLQMMVLAGIGCGLATITKGPLGLVFPILFAVLTPLRRDDLSRPGAKEWVVFALAALGVAVAWLIPAFLHDHGAYLRRVIFQPDLDVAGTRGSNNLFWYVKMLLLGFMPLTLLLPLLFLDLRRRGYTFSKGVSLAMFIVLSLIPKKRIHYLLPLYPILTLAVSDSLQRFSNHRWLVRTAQALVAVSLVAGPAYFALIQPRIKPSLDPDLTVATKVLGVVTADQAIYCLDAPCEEIAFLGRRKNVSQFADIDALEEKLERPPGTSYLVAPQESDERITAELADRFSLRTMLTTTVDESRKKQTWTLWSVKSSTTPGLP